MSKEVANSIRRALKEALAYAKADKSKHSTKVITVSDLSPETVDTMQSADLSHLRRGKSLIKSRAGKPKLPRIRKR